MPGSDWGQAMASCELGSIDSQCGMGAATGA
jgi:hypothetical protein